MVADGRQACGIDAESPEIRLLELQEANYQGPNGPGVSHYQQVFLSVVAPRHPLAEMPDPLQQLDRVLSSRGGKSFVSRADQLFEDPGILLLGLPDREPLPPPVVELAQVCIRLDGETAAPDQGLCAFCRARQVTGINRGKAVAGKPLCKQGDLTPSAVI